MNKINFASDNYSGVHPEVMQAIMNVNHHHAVAYGDDQYTKKAMALFKSQFNNAHVFFVFNGTGANVTSLCAMTKPYEAVICSDKAHIQMDECGAPEKAAHCKLLLISTCDGKLTPELIKRHLRRLGDQHHVQPRVISISQSTEYGTIYTPEEIKAISAFAHEHHLYLHMDGARLANATAALQTDLSAVTQDVGVDILSFGGTKNGLMLGEAVIIFNQDFTPSFKFIRKQNMQLASKMRYISAQFIALLENDLWLRNAKHANSMAQLLSKELQKISEIKITQAVQANAVFAIFPKYLIEIMQKYYHFYIWDESKLEVRLMTAFDTSEQEILSFSKDIKNCISQ
jgi:threonine aldolase